ncbi:hypothetical protein TNCV_5109461 [Trichonephila clavipes]|nr:hypothetical protein TNCV_5109461 [Trichonephila clavipes]
MTSPWQITNEWPFELCNTLESQQQLPDFNQQRNRKTAQSNDKRRKEKEPKYVDMLTEYLFPAGKLHLLSLRILGELCLGFTLAQNSISSKSRMSEKAGDIEENMEESHIESEFIEVTPEQACNNLQLLWGLARSKEAKLNFIKAELTIQEKTPIFNEEKIANFNKDKAMLEQELQSALGEIALISCPIDNCKIHYPRGNNANDANTKPKPDLNLKNLNTKNINDRINKVKRSGSEEFKLPKKTARTIKEIPIEQVICTKKNQFVVLEVEENPSMEESSDPPNLSQ